MVSNKYLFLFLLLCLLGSSSFAQTDSVALEAIKMRNSLDDYLLQNVGNKPNTLKEKSMAAKIDSLTNLTQKLAAQNAYLQNNSKPAATPIAQSNQQVYTLYYPTNSSAINKDGKELLRKILQENPNANYTIKGYSDAYGNPESNLSLSLKRAAQVRAFLQASNSNLPVEILAAETKQSAKNAQAKLARKVEIYVQ